MPPYQGFAGPSNPTQSLQADCERLVNLYVERVESPPAPTGAALYPTPGFSTYLTTADLEPRGAWEGSGRAFEIVGTGLYEVFSTGLTTLRGTVALDSNLATISYNGTTGGQLFITSGGNGYCYALATNILTLVLTAEATMGGMLNSRFLAFNTLNGKVRLSGLNDGLTWDPNLYFQRSQGADPWQSMLVSAPEIWLIGERTGEVWYDSGAFPQPFAPIPGAFFKYGTAAPFSAAVVGDYIVWLSQGAGGLGSIVAARGYTPQAISNFAVDTAIAGYARDSGVSDCEVLAYADSGHLFANFTFFAARKTWTVDLSMGMLWGERGRWDSANQRYDVWGPRTYMYAFNKHLVGNTGTGSLCDMNGSYGSEADGSPIRRMRIPPPLWATSRERLLVNRLELQLESGLGLTTGQGSDPQVMLRVSPDAKTWGPERMASAGKLGDYRKRIVWQRCGSSEKLWVPELTMTDPIPWRIAGAEIDGTGFAQNRAAA